MPGRPLSGFVIPASCTAMVRDGAMDRDINVATVES